VSLPGGSHRGPDLESARHSRRTFAAAAVSTAAAVWVAPSVIGLDKVAAASPSGPPAFSYTEDFQGAIGNASVSWSNVSTDTAPADPSRRFLGQFANNTAVNMTVALPAHTTVSLAFDLITIRSWDGSNVGSFNDRFQVHVDGVRVMNDSFAAAFVTAAGRLQTYGPNPTNPPVTDAVEVNTLGYTWRGNPADAVYRIEIPDIAHTAGTVTVRFRGRNLQGLSDESWGIDNVSFSAC